MDSSLKEESSPIGIGPKYSRNYEVMNQSPKPIKPILHLPQLEANRFNQLQTRNWQPGDHLNQSGDILGVQANWNLPKIFTEQEVMNFIIQRFLSPSICEYATLEEDSSPKKKRPEPKPIIGGKRSLLAFRKAQDLEKWSRKLEDMMNFPKPAKPALH